MQVHRNKPKVMFYVSCSIVTARIIWNWKYSKVITDEAFWSDSWPNRSQTLEAVIMNWYKSSNDNPDCSVYWQFLSLRLRHSPLKPAQILLQQNTKYENI